MIARMFCVFVMSKWFEFTLVEDAWFRGTSVSRVVWYQQLRTGWKRTDDQGSHPAIAYHCPGDNISWWITKWPIYNDLITGLFAAATLIECLSSKVASSSMGKSGQGRRLSSFRRCGDPTEKEIYDQCPNWGKSMVPTVFRTYSTYTLY